MNNNKRLLIISRNNKIKKRTNNIKSVIVNETINNLPVKDYYQYKNEKRRRYLFEYLEQIKL